ncbi:MAG: beta-lactamase family protein, partial [Gemmatimonadetes bacterium]|nr:beta-lactamase family protein [Gemmatimonadota bacterium]
SKGYSYGGGQFREADFEYVPLAPVGAATASAGDMSRFMMAHLQLGELDGQRVLSEETARLMQSDHHRMAPEVNAMAHGFMVYDGHGERIIGHGGDTRIFHTGLWMFPEHDFGLFVSFNSQQSGGARGRLFSAIMDRYFPVEEEIPPADSSFVDRAARFTGEYRANRFSHSTVAKLAALQTSSVSATSRGTLRAVGTYWVEESPLVFREEYGTRKLIFREDESGNITHFFLSTTPIAAFERVPVTEHPAPHLVIFILAIATTLLALLSPILGWIIRKWHKVPSHELVRIPGGARATLWFTALLFVVAAFLIGPNLTPSKLSVEVPGLLGMGFLFPILAGLMTLGAAVYAGRIWAKRQGRFTVRVFYSVAVLAYILFLWQLYVWNFLGWNY